VPITYSDAFSGTADPGIIPYRPWFRRLQTLERPTYAMEEISQRKILPRPSTFPPTTKGALSTSQLARRIAISRIQYALTLDSIRGATYLTIDPDRRRNRHSINKRHSLASPNPYHVPAGQTNHHPSNCIHYAPQLSLSCKRPC
jgi:hypothetical protein